MAGMNNPNMTETLKGFARVCLKDKLKELQGAPPLNGKVEYNDTEIDLAKIHSE